MGTVVGAGSVLVAGEVAVGAEGFLMEPIAVGVEVVLDEILVPDDVVFGGKLFGLLPGGRFDFEALDV